MSEGIIIQIIHRVYLGQQLVTLRLGDCDYLLFPREFNEVFR